MDPIFPLAAVVYLTIGFLFTVAVMNAARQPREPVLPYDRVGVITYTVITIFWVPIIAALCTLIGGITMLGLISSHDGK